LKKLLTCLLSLRADLGHVTVRGGSRSNTANGGNPGVRNSKSIASTNTERSGLTKKKRGSIRSDVWRRRKFGGKSHEQLHGCAQVSQKGCQPEPYVGKRGEEWGKGNIGKTWEPEVTSDHKEGEDGRIRATYSKRLLDRRAVIRTRPRSSTMGMPRKKPLVKALTITSRSSPCQLGACR